MNHRILLTLRRQCSVSLSRNLSTCMIHSEKSASTNPKEKSSFNVFSPGKIVHEQEEFLRDDEKEHFFRDFDYKLRTIKPDEVMNKKFRLEDTKLQPLILIFGWAGANHKNIEKYAKIYHEAGCSTLSYIIPSRFIFLETIRVPHLSERLLQELKKHNLHERPIYMHNFSDTGILVYQGMDHVIKQKGFPPLNIKGHIFDSCPAPIPKGTISQVFLFMGIYWICCGRDGYSLWQRIIACKIFLMERGFINIWRRLQGKEVNISLINRTWSGDFCRDELIKSNCPELFIYSLSDVYLPYRYLEEKVLKSRREAGREIYVQKWKKSPHVEHLKHHKKRLYQCSAKFYV
uniref:Transmembrane protein 53 n=1 Tax=Lepeophtheirus salmonis TaxID=72036 RepID=D3PHL9_LEPSM|nr:Transmembrane protein 53 [Lepeophtheirus salmonis]